MTYLYILDDGSIRQFEGSPEGDPPEDDLAAVRYGELQIVMFDDGDYYEYVDVGNDDWGWARVEEG